jgi:hypothetical protein
VFLSAFKSCGKSSRVPYPRAGKGNHFDLSIRELCDFRIESTERCERSAEVRTHLTNTCPARHR